MTGVASAVGSVGRGLATPGRRGVSDSEVTELTMHEASTDYVVWQIAGARAARLGPTGYSRARPGRQVALEGGEGAGPAQQRREALDAEAGPQQCDHGPVVGAGDPHAGGAARLDGVHEVAEDGRRQGFVQQRDRPEPPHLGQ